MNIRTIYILAVAVLTTLTLSTLTACKTTEKNYRQAYEKAIGNTDNDVTEFEHTIYNRYRGRMRDITVDVDGQNVVVHSLHVKVTPDGGGINEWLKRYCVVVAEFKQIFNASSMRQRMVDGGYPRTFIVENAEPYYYVVVESTPDIKTAMATADSIAAHSPVPLKDGFPYILQVPGR